MVVVALLELLVVVLGVVPAVGLVGDEPDRRFRVLAVRLADDRLGALVEARPASSEGGGSLSIVCNHERILKLFTITGLDGVFSIHADVEEALQSLRG